METNKNNKGIIMLIVILALLVVGFGGYLAYDKVIKDNNILDVNNTVNNNNEKKTYILDSTIQKQAYRQGWYSESKELGYIKLGDKEYKVSYFYDAEGGANGAACNKIIIGDKEFDSDIADEIYVIPDDSLLMVHHGSGAWLKVIDSNLNVKFEENNIITIVDQDAEEFINWNEGKITFYRFNNPNDTLIGSNNNPIKLDVCQIEFSFQTNIIKAPKLIRTIDEYSAGIGSRP